MTEPLAEDVVPDAPRSRWRRRPSRRVVLVALLGPLVAVFALLGIAYAATDVRPPSEIDSPQVSVITYDDGTEIGRIGAQNRQDVPLSKVSKAAQQAVLAAENRDYYSEPGISPKGILRAAWANIRGGGVEQGASTITQQYAKNAYLSSERTFSRKMREILVAVKLDRRYSKEQVLEYYLNTVYFGRGAYGIQVAAQTYFGKPAEKLTASEGAVLAALLRSPSGYDPAKKPEQARERWNYVIDGMREEGWLEGEPAYPQVKPRKDSNALAGPQGYLIQQVQDELEKNGITESEIASNGLRITTTIDRQAQAAAVKAVQEVTGKTAPKGVRRALVSVEPGTGRIRAQYAGDDFVTRPFNDVTQGIAQPGSSFKPFVLAAALDNGMSLKMRMDGTSPQTFGDYEVRNFGPGKGEQFGTIDLVQATVHSVNTVYVPLGEKAGLTHVAETAARLGVTADMSKDQRFPSFSLGVTAVRPLDQAVAYATLAARGVRAEPFLVQQVTDARKRVIYQAKRRTTEALPQSVADDTSFALQEVVKRGTGRAAQLPGRPAAGKTGTTTGNTAAWFVGYTPQLATAVALFSDKQDVPLRGIAGVDQVTGGSLPARTWQQFMSVATEGMPVKEFAPPVFGGNAPSPSPSASPSPSPSPSPSSSPSPLPSLSPAPMPSYVQPSYSEPSPYTEPSPYEEPSPYSEPSPEPVQEQSAAPAAQDGSGKKRRASPSPA